MAMIASALALALAAAAPGDEPLTLQGVGELRIGLPLAELRSRFGATPEYEPDPEMNCSYWEAPAFPGLAMMVVDDRLVRIDVTDARWRTRSGARIGMTDREVRAMYGAQMRVEPHPYTEPEGTYLVYEARDEPFGLIFETDNGRIISYRVGRWDNVQWIEGCS
jgi:hypothetical protein